MVHTTRVKLSAACIDVRNQRLFAPVLGAVHVHSIEVCVNGLLNDSNFWLLPPWLQLDPSRIGYRVSKEDNISVRAEYFYKAEQPGLLGFVTGCGPDLSFRKLARMIDTKVNAASREPMRMLMHEIRVLRNKVHPERLVETTDVTKYEATQAKSALQEILLFYMGKTVAY